MLLGLLYLHIHLHRRPCIQKHQSHSKIGLSRTERIQQHLGRQQTSLRSQEDPRQRCASAGQTLIRGIAECNDAWAALRARSCRRGHCSSHAVFTGLTWSACAFLAPWSVDPAWTVHSGSARGRVGTPPGFVKRAQVTFLTAAPTPGFHHAVFAPRRPGRARVIVAGRVHAITC